MDHVILVLILFGVLMVTSSELYDPEESCFEERCFPKVGCFCNGPPFGPPARACPPVEGPEDVCTHVFFSNPYIRDQEFEIYPEISSDLGDYIDPELRTYFLVHGYANTGSDYWMKNLSDAILTREPANVFRVDWKDGSIKIPNYPQATMNTRMAAGVMGLVREFLVSLGVRTENMHCIGHSLGAHVCAYFGKNSRTKLGRITGMDIAGPLFVQDNNAIRLSPNDAIFTDSIHTDSGLLGILGQRTQIQFVVNSGSLQPNCITAQLPGYFYKARPDDLNVTADQKAALDLEVLAGLTAPVCSHNIAYLYTIFAILNPGCYWGYKDSIENRVDGVLNTVSLGFFGTSSDCAENGNCVPFGLETVDYSGFPGSYVINTQANAPYCKGKK